MRDNPTRYIGRWKYCSIQDELIRFTLNGTVRVGVGQKTRKELESAVNVKKIPSRDMPDLKKMLEYLYPQKE